MWNLDGAWNGAGALPAPVITFPAFDAADAGSEVTLYLVVENAADAGKLTFSWVQTGGEDVVLTGEDTSSITFIAPANELAQYLDFDVTVTNESQDETVVEISVPVLSIVAGVTIIRPENFIDGGFNKSDATPLVMLYQHSDNYIYCTVKTANRQLINPANFPVVQYIIAEMGGKPILTLGMGEGVSQWEDGFLIHVDDKKLDENVLGKYRHQFVVHNIAGDKLPPVFAGTVKVKSVIQ